MKKFKVSNQIWIEPTQLIPEFAINGLPAMIPPTAFANQWVLDSGTWKYEINIDFNQCPDLPAGSLDICFYVAFFGADSYLRGSLLTVDRPAIPYQIPTTGGFETHGVLFMYYVKNKSDEIISSFSRKYDNMNCFGEQQFYFDDLFRCNIIPSSSYRFNDNTTAFGGSFETLFNDLSSYFSPK
jgi:hypothetical protein